MDCEGQRLQALQQRGRGRVQKFVAYAIHAAGERSGRALPASLGNDFFQRDALARAAPGGNDHLRIELSDLFGRDLLAGMPKNRPPAASTNSATQGCEAIRGLPHSSHQTRGLASGAVRARCWLFPAAWRDHASPRSIAPTVPAMMAMSHINIGARLRRETEKRQPARRISLTAFSW